MATHSSNEVQRESQDFVCPSGGCQSFLLIDHVVWRGTIARSILSASHHRSEPIGYPRQPAEATAELPRRVSAKSTKEYVLLRIRVAVYLRTIPRQLAYFFRNLRQRVFLEFLCVAVEFADAFGQLLCRHSIFIVHPAKSFLAELQTLFFTRLGCGRI